MTNSRPVSNLLLKEKVIGYLVEDQLQGSQDNLSALGSFQSVFRGRFKKIPFAQRLCQYDTEEVKIIELMILGCPWYQVACAKYILPLTLGHFLEIAIN